MAAWRHSIRPVSHLVGMAMTTGTTRHPGLHRAATVAKTRKNCNPKTLSTKHLVQKLLSNKRSLVWAAQLSPDTKWKHQEYTNVMPHSSDQFREHRIRT